MRAWPAALLCVFWGCTGDPVEMPGVDASAAASPDAASPDAAVASAGPSYLPLGEPGAITDLALIYLKDDNPTVLNQWSPDGFAPYITAFNDANQRGWLFDGFLFLELFAKRTPTSGHGYLAGVVTATNGTSVPVQVITPATQVDWQAFLGRYLNAVVALDGAIGTGTALPVGLGSSAVLGPPVRERRAVLALPNPVRPKDTPRHGVAPYDWGSVPRFVNGHRQMHTIDMSVTEDRILAVEWFIDEALRRGPGGSASDSPATQVQQVALSGFYWLEENVVDDLDVVPAVAEYVHERHLKLYWIPSWSGYVSAAAGGGWKQLGFDAVYVQPNYFQGGYTPPADMGTPDPKKDCSMGADGGYIDVWSDRCDLVKEPNPPGITGDYSVRVQNATILAKRDGLGLELELDSRVTQPAPTNPSTGVSMDSFFTRLETYLQVFLGAGVNDAGAGAAMAHYDGAAELRVVAPPNATAAQSHDQYPFYYAVAHWVLGRQRIADQ